MLTIGIGSPTTSVRTNTSCNALLRELQVCHLSLIFLFSSCFLSLLFLVSVFSFSSPFFLRFMIIFFNKKITWVLVSGCFERLASCSSFTSCWNNGVFSDFGLALLCLKGEHRLLLF
jgi:hypothetical protein